MFEQDLLVTRFTIPPLRSTLLARTHLLSILDQSRSVPLTLLLASAGFGKTTLLADWASRSAGQVAWLSLDEQDNDPTRFWTYLIAALRKTGATVGKATLTLLHSSQPPQLSSALTLLINELVELTQDTALILDDFHLLKEPALHASLKFFLQHLPGCLHLILASRVDPPLPLARLRARGQVLEIREADLRLREEEAARFLTQVMGLSSLSAEDIQLLEQRTEGWLAGLQLAALSLQRHQNVAAFLKAFAGSQRFLLDYVQEEILDALPEAQQHFLLKTSVLDRMNADLCYELTGEPASQQMLEALERAHLFLFPLDEERCWYRFHALFREALQARLQATQPELRPRLHRQAALWYQRQGWSHEALPHARASQDFSFLAQLLESYAERLFLQGEQQTLLSWAKQLPREVLNAHPRLVTDYILAFDLLFPFPNQQQEERGYLLQLQAEVEKLVQQEGSSLSPAERNLLQHRLMLLKLWDTGTRALSAGDVEQLSSFAASIQHLSLEDGMVWKLHSWGSLGMASRLSGNFPPMVAIFEESRKTIDKEQYPSQEVHILWILAVAMIALGHLRQARNYSETLRQLSKRLGIPVPLAAYPDLLQAQLAYEWNQLETAKSAAQAAIEKTAPLHYIDILMGAYEVMVRVSIAQHNLARAEQSVQEMEEISKNARIELFRPLIESLRAQLWLAQGRLNRALDWAEHTPYREQTPLYSREIAYLAIARTYIAGGQFSQALQLLATLRSSAEQFARVGSIISILALQIAALQAAGDRQEVPGLLLHLLTLTEPEGYVRVFLDLGEPMYQALRGFLAIEPGSDVAASLVSYAQMLLDAFAREQKQAADQLVSATASIPPAKTSLATISSLPEPLTAREKEVLRLIAQGATNQEIANRLVISLATVKKHIGSLLLKLAAENRTHAVARARELALL
ncbi:LuxR family transcriptional regulator [Ktedonosporobacter rubrisoli]|uniref:LuxR family transcriptional regulator n=1 Tax=Ktedonosporobacter rubrisoli TaxID=2509675 RepID=A0A4P6JSE5_KTERU|nr:LuxR C-terminal-related transcriptional regulator [Ktedonosporobacter rubrisoli]QBD78314.1 LuxR family transcriptional regulator [Ktedonosporobacter rubrisoli]